MVKGDVWCIEDEDLGLTSNITLLDSWQWTVDSRQLTVDSGQMTVYSGQWTVDNGQWTVDTGQCLPFQTSSDQYISTTTEYFIVIADKHYNII